MEAVMTRRLCDLYRKHLQHCRLLSNSHCLLRHDIEITKLNIPNHRGLCSKPKSPEPKDPEVEDPAPKVTESPGGSMRVRGPKPIKQEKPESVGGQEFIFRRKDFLKSQQGPPSMTVSKHDLLSRMKSTNTKINEEAEKEQKQKMRYRMITFGGTAILGLMAYVLHSLKKDKKTTYDIETAKKSVKPRNKVPIGGAFELVDQHGKVFTNEDIRGKWAVIYFGFCHCPDICPEELDKIASAVDIIDRNKHLPNVKPIFITVDPARDTPDKIKDYLEEYSPKFVGLTGSQEQTDKVGHTFRVYVSQGPVDEDNDYVLDHTVISYLIDPDGNSVDFYSRDVTAVEMARKIEKKMKEHVEG